MSAERSSQVAQSADGASNAIDQDHLLNRTAAAVIEPEQVLDDRDDDADSTLGSDVLSYTTSLKSAANNFITENGRRYHGFKPDGNYFLPNDEDELDRLDMFHHCLTLRAGGRLHLAPIDSDPQRILDLGTGTGIWAIEMGDMYPSAQVLGNDISPVQPTSVPPNVSFEVDDIESDWVYSSKFDYIHARYLAGSIKDWPRLVKQAYDSLKPGGWIELADFDMTFYTKGGEFKRGCPGDVWPREVADAIRSIGLEPEPGHQLEGWIRDAGFINVSANLLPVPLGPWPKDKVLKEVGTFDMLQFLEGLEAISLRVFINVLKWDPREVQVFLAQVRKDFLNPKMQMQHDYYIVYAQKPFDKT